MQLFYVWASEVCVTQPEEHNKFHYSKNWWLNSSGGWTVACKSPIRIAPPAHDPFFSHLREKLSPVVVVFFRKTQKNFKFGCEFRICIPENLQADFYLTVIFFQKKMDNPGQMSHTFPNCIWSCDVPHASAESSHERLRKLGLAPVKTLTHGGDNKRITEYKMSRYILYLQNGFVHSMQKVFAPLENLLPTAKGIR